MDLAEMIITAKSLSLLILLLHSFSQTSQAKNPPPCTPSSCGIIPNISYPFRLADDPLHCGDRRFELSCENDVAFLYLDSQKYHVKDINYLNSTIRLVDASINSTDICSFPIHSAYPYNFSHGYPNRDPYLFLTKLYPYPFITKEYISTSTLISLMSCPLPLNNSYYSLFTVDITHDCNHSSSTSRYTYVKLGHLLHPSELPHMCELDMMAMASWPKFVDGYSNINATLPEIHRSLLYGFELEFRTYSRVQKTPTWSTFRNFFIHRLNSPLLIIPVILVMLGAAVGPPVMALIGFTAVVGLITFIAHQILWKNKSGGAYDKFDNYGTRDDALSTGFVSSIIMVCAPRFIICLIGVWILIYKFRTRHLSHYETIESFLQSDAKLVPISYSYSNIKNMTRNFREKLGEGGYGSVYKGKLRSGSHVAIKMLGKSKANGQDFINEIATIGRIHHVNVINLVGYCAQGSKRALVFDFMPNGSLEKYLFNRDNKSTLSWDRKFEIAIGVARGIEYLHRGCDIQILHFDIKPHNILLDDKFVPKVSDFGLAKFCSVEKNTMTMTAAKGTIGYVAPELINRGIGRVSYKADVYSFGMLLMEMVGLNRDNIEKDGDSSKYFPCWIYDQFNKGMDIAMGNANENDDSDDVQKLGRKMTIVALWCIQMNPDDRPSMNKVLDMLEADVERLKIPEYPSESAQMQVNEDDSWGTCSSDSASLLYHNTLSMPSVEITIEE